MSCWYKEARSALVHGKLLGRHHVQVCANQAVNSEAEGCWFSTMFFSESDMSLSNYSLSQHWLSLSVVGKWARGTSGSSELWPVVRDKLLLQESKYPESCRAGTTI